MQFTTLAISALISLVGAQQLPSLPASILTAIPTEVIQGFIADPTSVIADIASSVSAGNPPEWYASLPEDVQQSLQAIAGTPPTGAPSGSAGSSAPATTDASATDIISSVIESVSSSVSESNASASSSMSESSASESSASESMASETDASATASSTDAATVPTAGVLGMGVAAFAGLVGVIAL